MIYKVINRWAAAWKKLKGDPAANSVEEATDQPFPFLHYEWKQCFLGNNEMGVFKSPKCFRLTIIPIEQ